jgi:uncharacterized protein (DUF1778 family)
MADKDRLTAQLTIRVTAEEKKLIEEQAEKEDRTVSAYARRKLFPKK